MKPALELEGLVKAYPLPGGGSVPVLDVPSFRLGAGEQAALSGGSGTGKTTLLHLIAGILRPDAGSVRVGGEEISALGEAARDRARARLVGYVFQSFHLLQGLTSLENVLVGMSFGGRSDAARAESLLRRVGLGDRLHHRPSQLSVGQQQRVAVARALAKSPALVLADEPTGNLDRRLARETVALIRETCREAGAALLLVSHDGEALGAFEAVRELGELNRAARAA